MITDGQCPLSFSISKTKHAFKNLTTDITITSKILIQAKNILPYFMNTFDSYFNAHYLSCLGAKIVFNTCLTILYSNIMHLV